MKRSHHAKNSEARKETGLRTAAVKRGRPARSTRIRKRIGKPLRGTEPKSRLAARRTMKTNINRRRVRRAPAYTIAYNRAFDQAYNVGFGDGFRRGLEEGLQAPPAP